MPTKINKQETVTKNRFVGFIDIMGFKDMVARKTHLEIYRTLKHISDFKSEIIDEGYYGTSEFYMFSDSIIIFSKDDTLTEMKELTRNMRVLVEKLLVKGIPFRGSIAFGEVTVDKTNSIFFGQAQIDAYLLSEDMAIYAIGVHHSAQIGLKKDRSFNKRFICYDCPMKGGIAKHYILSPFKNFFEKNNIEKLIDNFRGMTSGSIRKYIDNTQKYLVVANNHQKENYPKKV